MYLSSSIATNIPIIASVGAIVSGIFILLLFRPAWAFSALFLSLMIGQTLRLPITGQGGGILISDIVIPIVALSLFFAVVVRNKPLTVSKSSTFYGICIFPFLLYSFLLLALHERALGIHSFAIAFLYWVRLFGVLLVFPMAAMFGSVKSGKEFIRKGFVSTYWMLITLGYMQIFIFPSLVGNINGWDPHIHRMISTWFDPNFFGAFIVIGMMPALYWSRFKIPLFVLSCGALLLTASRSSWIACIAAMLVTGCFFFLTTSLSQAWKKAIHVFIVICILLVVTISGVFSDRVVKLFTHDPTVSIRTEAYKEVWRRMVEPNIVFGVGYNAYQFSAKDAGLIQDFSIHSRAGSDNSIITLLVTTGIIGTALFLIPILFGLYWHAASWILSSRKESLLYIWSAIALLVHSQFENSLLYPHLLIPFLLISALVSI